MKTEFTEVLTGLVQSHFPDMEVDKVDALLKDIISHVGELDYRFMYDSLCYEHMDCLEEIKKLKSR